MKAAPEILTDLNEPTMVYKWVERGAAQSIRRTPGRSRININDLHRFPPSHGCVSTKMN
jgi:hypothetical protein